MPLQDSRHMTAIGKARPAPDLKLVSSAANSFRSGLEITALHIARLLQCAAAV